MEAPEVDAAWWDQPWLPPLLAAVTLLLALAFLLGWLQGRRRAPTSSRRHGDPGAGARDHPPESGVAAPTPPSDSGVGLDALVLAGSLITLHDLADDGAGRRRIEQLLRRGGVERIPAEPGTDFDDRWHHAVSTTPGPPGTTVTTVDSIVRPGWQAGARILRPAEVTVRVPVQRADRPDDSALRGRR